MEEIIWELWIHLEVILLFPDHKYKLYLYQQLPVPDDAATNSNATLSKLQPHFHFPINEPVLKILF